MNVGLRVSGRLNLDHQVDIGDVEASGGDVGGDQHIEFALLESLESDLALVLPNISVHHLNVVLDLVSENQLIGVGLGLREHDSLARAVGVLTSPVNYEKIGQDRQSVVERAIDSQVIDSLSCFVLEVFGQINDSVVLLQVL